MIAFKCPGCGNEVSVNDNLAGQPTACPHCFQSVAVPAAAAPSSSPWYARRTGKIIGAGVAGLAVILLVYVVFGRGTEPSKDFPFGFFRAIMGENANSSFSTVGRSIGSTVSGPGR
jgi:hypothetical protein